MKLSLPSKPPLTHAFTFTATAKPMLPPASTLRGEFYGSAEESARRKKALIAQMDERRAAAKATLLARRGVLRPGAAAHA